MVVVKRVELECECCAREAQVFVWINGQLRARCLLHVPKEDAGCRIASR
jgi:hypothetical protein